MLSSSYVLVLVALFALSSGVGANVMGIDLGSDFLKVASPHGNNTIDIVLNEQTRRKSNNFVGFRADDRFFGDDAKSLAARFPDNMFAMVNKLVGIEWGSAAHEGFSALLHTFQVVENSKRPGTVSVKCEANPVAEYSAEELVGMLFHYCKTITAKDAKIKPIDAVVTVPADVTFGQRQGLVDAASLVDLRLLSLLHSTTASALQYGMQRRGFGNDTVYVVIYDMGATKTEVGVYKFSPPLQPKAGERIKLAVSMGHLETLHIEVDSTLGGRTFDTCIARMLEDEIVATMKLPRIIGGTTLQQHKAQFSLLRAANTVKETLSANAGTPVTVEAVAPDRDFTTKVTREQFESRCAPLFERAVAVARRALERANVTTQQLLSFELMGGGLRPPKIVAELSSFLGRNVDRTLNGDESAAFGAAYYGSRLSSYFRVRSFSVADYVPATLSFAIVALDGSRSALRPLFERPQFGARKSITLRRESDFVIQIFESAGVDDKIVPLFNISVSGVRSGLESMSYFDPRVPHENNTHQIRVEIRISETGLPVVDDVEVRYRYAANVTKKGRSQKSKQDTSATRQDGDTTVQGDEQAPATDATDTDNSAEQAPQYEIQMKKRATTLKATIRIASPPPMSGDDLLASKSILAGLDKIDRVKRETASAKNNLETYLQWVRGEGILENDEASSLMSAEERAHIEAAWGEVKEWYEDGEGSYDTCTKADYEDKLSVLQNATASVQAKLQQVEESRRPKEATTPSGDKKAKKAKPAKRKRDAEEPMPGDTNDETFESAPASEEEAARERPDSDEEPRPDDGEL